MVTIEPIKNQYLTALKERQQIIDKVNEIIKDLNNLNFNDLINLNNKIEEIKTEIAQIENDLSNKVNKNGDIISGSLQLNTDTDNSYIIKRNDLDRGVVPSYPSGDDTNVQTLVSVLDKNNSTLAYMQRSDRSVGTVLSHVINQTANGSVRNHQMNQIIGTDGSLYVTIPSWSPGTNDNSDKILTIKMANSLPSLVHSTGNETINGAKLFTSRPINKKSSDVGMEMISEGFNRDTTYTSYVRPVQFICRDMDGDITFILQQYAESNNRRGLDLSMYDANGSKVTLALKSDGTKIYATAPTTPLNATSNEIATADWLISKINELATKNNLAGL